MDFKTKISSGQVLRCWVLVLVWVFVAVVFVVVWGFLWCGLFLVFFFLLVFWFFWGGRARRYYLLVGFGVVVV